MRRRRAKFHVAIEGYGSIFFTEVAKRLQSAVFIERVDTFSQKFQGESVVVNTKYLLL